MLRLKKETLKNEELLKNELYEKSKRIASLETANEDSERTHTLFIENLNRDIQTLQETLKNSRDFMFLSKYLFFQEKNAINNYAAEIQKLNNTVDDLKREKYILQTQVFFAKFLFFMNLAKFFNAFFLHFFKNSFVFAF